MCKPRKLPNFRNIHSVLFYVSIERFVSGIVLIPTLTNKECALCFRMDPESGIDESYYIALYAVLSFVVVILLVLLIYVACTKKYRLNWFEKNLLETAETKELAHRWFFSIASSSCTWTAPPISIEKFNYSNYVKLYVKWSKIWLNWWGIVTVSFS